MSKLTNDPAADFLPHPLEVIPAFRRTPRSQWRNVLYTLLLTMITTLVIAAFKAFEVPSEFYGKLLLNIFVVALSIGGSIHFLIWLAGRTMTLWFPDIGSGPRTAVGLLASVVGGGLGYWFGANLYGISFLSGTLIVSLSGSAILISIAITQRRTMTRQLELERERSARVEAERLMTIARLQTLQAQIEPHFLFNTLANVSSLIEAEPKQARRMLDQFTLLLRASLDQTRKATTTLRAELQVVEAYLSVLKVRMGERLSYRIDAPQDLLSVEVPSMFLQPIVENAVKHGTEPRMTGGVVQVEARREADKLVFIVTDDGVGFVAGGKENIGLGAVRERLAVQYGDAASLNIERTTDNFTRVSIRIPFPSDSKSL